MAEVSTHKVTCSRCARELSLISLGGSPQFFALEEVGAYYALVGAGEATEICFVCSVDCAELVQADPPKYMTGAQQPSPTPAGDPLDLLQAGADALGEILKPVPKP